MERIIIHWTGGTYRANSTDRKHYHSIFEGDGREVRGNNPVHANVGKLKSGKYAAHTLNLNSGSIGLSCASMYGAVENPESSGSHPVTEKQWNAMAAKAARYCVKYDIRVTRKTVLSHAEVQGTLGVKQRNKWDYTILPFDPATRGAFDIGQKFREKVRILINSGPSKNQYEEILYVQKRLKELGYYEVGQADGVIGTRTEGAILAFRNDNNLPISKVINKKLVNYLRIGKKRKVGLERSGATVEDLRQAGSTDIIRADMGGKVGKIAAGVATGATVSKPLLEQISNLSAQSEDTISFAERVLPIIAQIPELITDNALVILGIVGIFIWWKSTQAKKNRIEKHRTGEYISR